MAKKWTPSEEKYLLDNYGKVPMTELADRFGVTRKSISAKLDKLRAVYGIKPAGSGERGVEPSAPAPTASQALARPVAPNRRPQPRKAAQPSPAEPAVQQTYGTKVPSGLYILTEEGWKPILINKDRVSQ
jgi:hypothetical protein